MTLDRRDFCKTLIGGAAVLSARSLGAAQLPARAGSDLIQTVQLGENIVQVSGAGANVVVLAQPDGLLMVNGGSAERANELLDVVGRLFPDRPVRVLFNTDWGRENTGLNASLGSRGARIIAHENTRLWLGADFTVKWSNQSYHPLPAHARPNETLYATGKLTFGDEPVAYGSLGQAHTDGDIYVHFPRQNVLVAGHTVTVGSYPIPDYSTGGWIGGLTTAASTLLTIAGADTRVIPGVGAVQSRAHLQAERDMLATLRDRFVKMLKQGLSADEMIASAPTKEFDETWGSPQPFLKTIYPGLWGHARELGGIV